MFIKAKKCKPNESPLVSVLIPTHNRRRFLSAALGSVVRQNYSNLEIFVIRDGGEDVSDVVKSFNDPRIIFIDRSQNFGKAFSLNEALGQAKGKYVAYLDDDDLYYSNHIETLVAALENETDCKVAYTDLLRTYCRVRPGDSREVLSKVLEVSRDFDRFLMLCMNHTLHVSLMHHRDLLDKAGLYNEDIKILIDWDLSRRLVFFSDFYHVHKITGEYYTSVGESDRISIRQRQNKNEYANNLMTIRTTRPAKPWDNIKDLSIIFADNLTTEAAKTISSIWRHTFYPYQLYLPFQQADLDRLNTDMPNIVTVPIDCQVSQQQRIDTALAKCEGEYVAVVPGGFAVRDFWVEDSLYALINSSVDKEALELEGSTEQLWAVVAKKDDLQYARGRFPNLPLRESLRSAGINIRRIRPEEIPFKIDQLLFEARVAEQQGDLEKAAQILEYISENYRHGPLIKSLVAKAFFKTGHIDKAGKLACEINHHQPTVDTLLLEARVNRRENNFEPAIELLERAEQMLEGPALQDSYPMELSGGRK